MNSCDLGILKLLAVNILIFAPNHIGDAVMSTPLILTLKENFPDSKIYLFARKKVIDIYTPFPAIDYLFEYDNSINNTLRKLKGVEFEYSFCLASSLKVALISWLLKAKKRIGYGRNWRSPFLNCRLKYYRNKPIYIRDFYLRLLDFLSLKFYIRTLKLFTLPEVNEAVLRRLESFGITLQQDKIAVLLPGHSGYTPYFKTSKDWNETFFAEVGKFLISVGFKVLILVGPREEVLAESIQNICKDIIPIIKPSFNLQEAKAFLQYIRVFVSVDSGLRFIARAYGKRGVTLYGPISPYWSIGKDSEEEIPLYLNLTCSPCDLYRCPFASHPCLGNITPSLVIEKLKLLI